MKTKIFCYGCNEEINALDKCPLCGTVGDIGFEESREWHWLCRLWASGKGYWGEKETVSLPLWFERNPDLLPQWETFKARLLDVTAIPLPEHLKRRYGETYEFWGNNCGILILQHGTLSDLISQPPIGPLVHKLALNFAEYHRGLWEAEDRLEQEEEEKSKNEKRKEGRRRRNHERV